MGVLWAQQMDILNYIWKMMEHILEKHKEEFEILSEMHQEEIRAKMDFLLTRGCGCGVKEL